MDTHREMASRLRPTKPDCNQELRPGSLEIGLHQYFGLPATNDRISTVFVRDHRVVGLDCSEAIHYTYDPAEAKSQGMSAWVAGGKFPW